MGGQSSPNRESSEAKENDPPAVVPDSEGEEEIDDDHLNALTTLYPGLDLPKLVRSGKRPRHAVEHDETKKWVMDCSEILYSAAREVHREHEELRAAYVRDVSLVQKAYALDVHNLQDAHALDTKNLFDRYHKHLQIQDHKHYIAETLWKKAYSIDVQNTRDEYSQEIKTVREKAKLDLSNLQNHHKYELVRRDELIADLHKEVRDKEASYCLYQSMYDSCEEERRKLETFIKNHIAKGGLDHSRR